jgi:hypothetical protein
MECFFVAVLDIKKYLISCAWILGFLHVQEMHNHPINNLCLSIGVRVEDSGFGDLSVQC